MKQQTLAEETVDKVECEYHDACSGHAAYEVNTMVYDGVGWVRKDVLTCKLCRDEWAECKQASRVNEKQRQLQAHERWE